MRKVFLDELPKRNYQGNDVYDWNKTIGREVKFTYDGINGYFIILKYDDNYNLHIKYDNEVYKIRTNNFTRCKIGSIIGKISKDFKINIGDNFISDKRNITIINRKLISDRNKRKWKWYKYKCNICGWNDGWIVESSLLDGCGCSCCSGKTTVEGINDIPSTAPWMVKYFQNGYDEAKLYMKNSNKRIYPICPDCGKIKNKSLKIQDIYCDGSIGCECSDGISYGEKIIISLLNQLRTKFYGQYSKSNSKWCDKYRYDFMIPSNKTIIEVHGIQHYESSSRGRSLIEEQENDILKKELAIKNGVINYIIINARYSNIEWIKNSIMESELPKLLAFNNTDISWEQCEKFTCTNLIKDICQYKNEHNEITAKQISEKFPVCKHTVIKYLKIGTKLNWCKYDPKQSMIDSNRKNGKKFGKRVEIFKNGDSFGVYESCTQLSNNSKELIGVGLTKSMIAAVASGKRKQHKGYTFQYI